MHNVTTVIITTAAESAPELRAASGWFPLHSGPPSARAPIIHTGITPQHRRITRRPSIPIRGAAGIRNTPAITPAEPPHRLQRSLSRAAATIRGYGWSAKGG